MRSNYERSLSYAWKCCPPLYKDIVHTAYVRHFTKHGTNLFDRDIFVVLRWVKNVWFNEIRDSKYQKDGVLHTRQMYDVTDLNLASKFLPPDSELITKEFYQELFKRVDDYTSGHSVAKSIDPKVLRQFLELVDTGYTYPEICVEMGMSAQRLHYYKQKIKRIIEQMEMKSPLNGHRISIKMKITRKHYEAHPEKYKEFVYDPNRDSDFNEAYEILVNPAGEYLLIREKGD